MAVTPTPIFAQTPNIGVMNALLTTAMTNTKAFDGTDVAGTSKVLVFTAGVDGSRIDKLNVKLRSTNGAAASGTTSANLVRFWINNGSSDTTATNNMLIDEIAVPAQTVTALGTSVLVDYSDVLNISIPANYKIYAGTTAAVGGTNCAIQVSVLGGNY